MVETEPDTYGEKIDYVAISPDGSIVANFNPYSSSISITKVVTSETMTNEAVTIEMSSGIEKHNKTEIGFDKRIFKDKNSLNIIRWSLAVSDVIDNDIGLIAISCITSKNTNQKNQKETMKVIQKIIHIIHILFKKYLPTLHFQHLMIFIFISYYFYTVFYYTKVFIYMFLIIIPIYILYIYEYYYARKILKTDVKQCRLSSTSSEGMIKLFMFSFNNNDDTEDISPINYFSGIVNFLKHSKNSLKNSATLICTDYMKIQKIKIKLFPKRIHCGLHKNVSVSNDGTYLLPENLFKKLEYVKDEKCIWEYLLKSMYQEFLISVTYNQQKINIEIYDINNLQLVNVFYSHCNKECLISNDNKPGIFAISMDSRLFAYSYGDNIITIYLMESGLEVVTKRFNDICEIKFLEFIEDDKKLLIIEQSDVKFYTWLISGCLDDYFPITGKTLPDSDISLSKYNTFKKANGTIVFHNKDEGQSKVVNKIENIDRTTIGESDVEIDEYECNSYDLEPWNITNVTETETVRGSFLKNDKRFLLIIGHNSIQLWKSKYIKFADFNDFNNFENSDLVYILISDKIKPTTKAKFIIDDMDTVITHACKSLAYLYKRTKGINYKEKHQKFEKFVNIITNIIEDFIKRYPDNWRLMEVQYPLMAYLIYSRSFSLIKYILFGINDQSNSHTEKLHKPANYNNPKLSILNDLHEYLELKNEKDKPANDLELALKLKDEPTDDELALEIHQGRNAIILAYLLEYYFENSMTHIGWMINVTTILPELFNNKYYADLMNLLLCKPCFGEMKYNFPIKRFRALSVCQDTLKVYVPLTNLISTNSLDPILYDKMSKDILPDIHMVPFINFTTHNDNIKTERKLIIRNFLRDIFFPPG
ncbi:hypothetical protein GLOIN_2v1784346 [Rhizophagus irregularis DAOM 181602=DAOM 197198]|uniref:Uncharacterized protein n=1 Tax=Rhizophagus irregularis (strain DAOM 197198w) TaxID=1432141 RepID=A0A015KF74_RHIIW|nr:hypothetical protein RirG_016500 [Rhizophagus irregularis DAOM 197198w]GET64915.1 hypothetical protein GLOIN_2v1784346 [Rhizophagus irregularis DAOM 181602=DAOM 197198]